MRIFTLILCLIFIACNDDKSKQIDNTNPKEQNISIPHTQANEGDKEQNLSKQDSKDSNPQNEQNPKDSSKEEDEKHKEKMKNIAGHYDARAYNGKGGYNAYQKKEFVIDEISDEVKLMRPTIITLYENMSLNEAYKTYLQNAGGHFTKIEGKILWLSDLPKESKHEEILVDYYQIRPQYNEKEKVMLYFDYIYENPKKLFITYEARNVGEVRAHIEIKVDYTFILLFEEKEEGTYLTLSNKPKNVSFDCKAKGLNATEKAICDSNLILDRKLDIIYETLHYQLYDSSREYEFLKSLKTSQNAWIKSRNACGIDMSCITQSYKDRIAILSKQLRQAISESGFDENCKIMRSVTHYGGWDPGEEYVREYQCLYKNAKLLDIYSKYASKHNEGIGKWLSVNEIEHHRPNNDDTWELRKKVDDPKLSLYAMNYEWANDNKLSVHMWYEYNPKEWTFTQVNDDVVMDFIDTTIP